MEWVCTLFYDIKIQEIMTISLTYVALAYAIHDKNEIRTHAEWTNLKYKKERKPKTIVLLDSDHDVLGFGLDAKEKLRIYHPRSS